MSPDPSHRAVERAARESYGRLLAYLAARWRDVAAVEDALSEALLSALRRWPAEGVPANPEAWLLTVARNRLLDGARRAKVREGYAEAVFQAGRSAEGRELPDERLRLLFVCAHPAINPNVRTPLMLQTVLGLDAARIADAFLVAPATMGQRLVRAKGKIRAAGIPFTLDPVGFEGDRLPSVLDAVYAGFNVGWDRGADSELATEALWLGRALTELAPQETETWGLLALMAFAEARRDARRTADGAFVPLGDQDARRWDGALIAEADAALRRASGFRQPGRFGLEAAIQGVHVDRRRTGRTDGKALVRLYDALLTVAPSVGARLGRAAALAETEGADAALGGLAGIDEAAVARHQPYWALLASLHARRGDREAASAAYTRAEGLSEDPDVRRFLAARRAAL